MQALQSHREETSVFAPFLDSFFYRFQEQFKPIPALCGMYKRERTRIVKP